MPYSPEEVFHTVSTILHGSTQIFKYFLIYLFGVLCCFQHCTGHITTGSWKGRGNQYIQFVRVLYCKLPTNGKQLSHLRPCREPHPGLRRWRRECYHSATVAPKYFLKILCCFFTLFLNGCPCNSWILTLAYLRRILMFPSIRVRFFINDEVKLTHYFNYLI